MVTRLMDDGSQLKPDQEPESSGKAIDASASSATLRSIEYMCSEGISPTDMVIYQGACMHIRWGLDGRT